MVIIYLDSRELRPCVKTVSSAKSVFLTILILTTGKELQKASYKVGKDLQIGCIHLSI